MLHCVLLQGTKNRIVTKQNNKLLMLLDLTHYLRCRITCWTPQAYFIS